VSVPILEQGNVVIASLQQATGDSDLDELQERLLDRVSRHRARGVVVDVSAVDVMDSYSVRVVRTIAQAARLCGARTVIVGIQPEVAFSMTELGIGPQLGIGLQGISTALDLDDGLLVLASTADR